MFCERDAYALVKGHRVCGERRVRRVGVSVKWFKCDSSVSDYAFAHYRDMIDLMRRGLWTG